MLPTDSSFWQYKVCMGIRRTSLEKRHHERLGSHASVAMRTCCGRILKFIRCVRNKLAGSSDVGFGGDRRTGVAVRHFGDRK